MSADAKAADLSSSLEDYLETIYLLVQERQFARVKDIANARDVKAGSVSPALKRLADLGLVTYVQREYVGLTPEGEQAARRVFARHQLLTRFFEEVLQMPAEAAERQACAMEHSLSNEGMDSMVRFFEFLHVCPNMPPNFLESFRQCDRVHGGRMGACTPAEAAACKCDSRLPILDPRAADGHAPARPPHTSVSKLKPGESGRVTQVNSHGAIRQRLLDMGLLPDVVLAVERVAPTGDPVWIKLQGSQIALRRKEAEAVRVQSLGYSENV